MFRTELRYDGGEWRRDVFKRGMGRGEEEREVGNKKKWQAGPSCAVDGGPCTLPTQQLRLPCC